MREASSNLAIAVPFFGRVPCKHVRGITHAPVA